MDDIPVLRLQPDVVSVAHQLLGMNIWVSNQHRRCFDSHTSSQGLYRACYENRTLSKPLRTARVQEFVSVSYTVVVA